MYTKPFKSQIIAWNHIYKYVLPLHVFINIAIFQPIDAWSQSS